MTKNLYKLSFIALFLMLSGSVRAQLDSSLAPFYHGVASGDPASNMVNIWTRVSPTVSGTVSVSWRMATDTNFTNIVASGVVTAKQKSDYTVNVAVSNLQANKWYYYQFSALGKYSLTGRTRTLPSGNNVDSIRMAVFACTNYQAGFFNAYEALANRNDVDVLLHLGDWIYEYGVNGFGYDASVNRPHNPTGEAKTLANYRKRHAQYRLDKQSIWLLQNYPLIAIWDDHEVANDAYKDGAENHQPLTEGDWYKRLREAKQAFFEWMPVRKPDPNGDSLRLYRNFTFGNLIKLEMLDTRLQGRTIQLASGDAGYNDTSRTMLGIGQREWLFNDLNTSTVKWNILGQQVMMAPMTFLGAPLNTDQWDGYPAERTRMYNTLTQNSSKNFVVLTGDIHSAWGNDLKLAGYSSSNRSASAGVEFVAPSVTSPNPLSGLSSGLIQVFNSHARYVDLSYNGFMIIDVNKNRVQGDWYSVSTIKSLTYSTAYKAGWYVNANEKFLRQAASASSRPANKKVAFAPAKPMTYPRLAAESMASVSELNVYPNPFSDIVFVELTVNEPAEFEVFLYDMQGRSVMTQHIGLLCDDTFIELNLAAINEGTYILMVQSDKELHRIKLIKN